MSSIRTFGIILLFTVPGVFSELKTETDDECHLVDYKATCILDILEEHVVATAIVNHCHDPLDITFRVKYRYGNGTEQRWQYTFVTTNQNERVQIPGLVLPVAKSAMVFLYTRVPELVYDLRNASVVAIEVSFVAVLDDNSWEEVEFLNDAVLVDRANGCRMSALRDPLLISVGAIFVGFLVIGGSILGVCWWYKKKKEALDELALVNSLEMGLQNSQPYQLEPIGLASEEKRKSQGEKDIQESKSSPPTVNGVYKNGFRFGRLKEDRDEMRDRAIAKCESTLIIGNPILVGKNVSHSPNSHGKAADGEVLCNTLCEESETGTNASRTHVKEANGHKKSCADIRLANGLVTSTNYTCDAGSKEVTHDEPDVRKQTDKQQSGARPKVIKKAVSSQDSSSCS